MYTAFVPAKGKSEGVPEKNLKLLRGKSLLARTLDFALAEIEIDHVVVSTESSKIIAALDSYLVESGEPFDISVGAKNFGVFQISNKISLHLRHPTVAHTYARTSEVLIDYLDRDDRSTDWVCLLQPTSPFRKKGEMAIVSRLQSKNPNSSVASIAEAEHPHPEKCFSVTKVEDFLVCDSLPRAIEYPRQSLLPKYHLDGAFYSSSTASILSTRSILGTNTVFFQRFGASCVSIDTEIDFQFAEFIVDSLNDK